MADSPHAGQGPFATSIPPLRRLLRRFEQLDERTHGLPVVLFHANLRSIVFDNLDRQHLLAKSVPDSVNTSWQYGGRGSHAVRERDRVFFQQSHGWIISGQEGQHCVRRQYVAFESDCVLADMKSIADDTATLLAYEMNSMSPGTTLFPDVPTQAILGVREGLWFDFVFELARWGLPCAPIGLWASGWVVDSDDEVGSDGEFHVRVHGGYRINDSEATDLWTKPVVIPIMAFGMEKFASASVATLDLLIQWGETGVNPFQSRVDAQSVGKPAGGEQPEATSEPTKATTSQSIPPGSNEPTATPKDYVIGWADILQALNRDNNATWRGRVERLNESHNGPIIKGATGQQPTVVKTKLIAWWNGLEEILESQQSNRTNTAATVSEQYPHGRDATVVPGISGQVKKRRSPRGGSQPTNDR